MRKLDYSEANQILIDAGSAGVIDSLKSEITRLMVQRDKAEADASAARARASSLESSLAETRASNVTQMGQ